jgi:hypothetical protein
MEQWYEKISRESIDKISDLVNKEKDSSLTVLSRKALSLLQSKDNGMEGKSEKESKILLLKLHREGYLELRDSVLACCNREKSYEYNGCTKYEGDISEIGKIELLELEGINDPEYRIWTYLINKYHYLGASRLYGQQVRYLVRSEKIGYIGAMSFSSAAWRLQARDTWIGWDEESRIKNLKHVICNSRFLIVPEVRVKNLASHILSRSMQHLVIDWTKRYKTKPYLVETFVEKGRYSGTSYQAANFQKIGQTQGRGRQDRKNEYVLTVKEIYVYPLCSKYRHYLCDGKVKETQEEKEKSDWAEEEFGKANLGDKRLVNRLLTIARDFYSKPEGNIPQACESRAKTKATYRFFDNEEVNMEDILSSHYQSTIERVKKERVVLSVQDTTSLNYSTHPATENLGLIGSKSDCYIGLIVHDTMAFNLEGTPLGLLNVQCWTREKEKFGKRHKRRDLPIEEKESYKWLKSLEAATEVQKQCPQTMIVSVGDREADIYELFERGINDEQGAKLLIRAEQNRTVLNEQMHLWEYMEQQQPEKRTQELFIPRQGKRPSRTAELQIRYAPVELKAPRNGKKKGSIKVWAILAKEDEPEKKANVLEWMLLTDIPVNTFEEAVEKLTWYSLRWNIEVYHKTLKSGCKIETRQLGNADRIEACLAIDMVIAWRIYHLTKLGREVPDLPCTVFFEEAEWKALVAYKTKNPIPPMKPPTLREAVRMVASLGGFLGRKCDGEPGPKPMWLGLQKLDSLTEMWKIFASTIFPDLLGPPLFSKKCGE